jgi:hypothetical protein
MAINPVDVSTTYKLVDGTAMSATITSKAIDIQGATHCGVEYYSAAAGDRAGTLAIQETISGENWHPVTFTDGTTSITVTASTLLSGLKNLAGLGGRWIRVVFTYSSGTTGTLDCWVLPKYSAKS